jgi:hypothetical protein
MRGSLRRKATMQGETKPRHGAISWGLIAMAVLVASAVGALILFILLMAALGFFVF